MRQASQLGAKFAAWRRKRCLITAPREIKFAADFSDVSADSFGSDPGAAVEQTPGGPINAHREARRRCEGGPLHGELHDEGEAFEFDGRPLGLEPGVYRLLGEIYSWEPAGPAVLKLHEPPADE